METREKYKFTDEMKRYEPSKPIMSGREKRRERRKLERKIK